MSVTNRWNRLSPCEEKVANQLAQFAQQQQQHQKTGSHFLACCVWFVCVCHWHPCKNTLYKQQTGKIILSPFLTKLPRKYD